MPWNCSKSHSLSPDDFLALAEEAARVHRADLLLSGCGFSGEQSSHIFLSPETELVISQDTQPSEIQSFCFESPTPAIGWLSYELGMRLREVETFKPALLPQGHLRKYGIMIQHDAATKECNFYARTEELLSEALALMEAPKEPLASQGRLTSATVPSLTRNEYEEGVHKTLEHIRDGQAYQLNLSVMFEQQADGLDSIALFFDLFRAHPAPFYALFTSGDQRILSTSPERFIKVDGGRVLSRPIKGTRVVRQGEDETQARVALRRSPKESAELSMIVDLIRNDISHHCEYGSVKVHDHLNITRVDDLLQMHSDVTGTLRPGSTCLDLLFDALPGGSITGCPKRRAMELIEDLEPHARGIYCGNFLFIEDEQTMDSSICIRTAVHNITQGTFTFYAGSGIVVDSEPAAEYEETMAKAGKFLRGGKR